MADERWLTMRGRTWYAVKDVPRPLRVVVGKKRLLKSLQTRDLSVARARRHNALAEFALVLAAAQAKAGAPPETTAALEWRAILAANPAEAEGIRDEIADAAYDLEDRLGYERAKAFHALATGQTTPLLHFVDAWIIEGHGNGPVTPRTARQYRSDLAAFHEWLHEAGLPDTIEAVTRKVAGRYVSEGLAGKRVHPKTANRKISAASAYWRWLIRKGHTETNPWRDQALSTARKPTEAGDKDKRSFTDEEVSKLLKKAPDDKLSDAMCVAALSGMRLEEIFQLKVADCAAGWFNVRFAKTKTGIRPVPIHSDLAAIVARRTAGKPPTAFLFHEAGGPAKEGTERSMPISKRFGRYRKGLGVDERAEGQRQSAVDFHSFRRWFITTAERADQMPHIISAVVGHDAGRQTITLKVYSDGPAERQARACVEAVRLPLENALNPG